MKGCAILTNNKNYKDWLLKHKNIKEAKGRNRLFSEEYISLNDLIDLDSESGQIFVVRLFNNTLVVNPSIKHPIDLEMRTTDSDELEELSKIKLFYDTIEDDKYNNLITTSSGFSWDDPYIYNINIKNNSRLLKEFSNIIDIASKKNNGSEDLPEYIDNMIIYY